MTIADVRVGLKAYLLGDGAISAAVGGDRIYPVILKQGTTATSIVYSRISGLGDHHMQGPSGLNQLRMQVDCWAASIDAANTLANLVKERLDGFKGSMLWGDNSPAEAIVIQGIFFDSERENFDNDVKLYRVSRDYMIWVAER